MSGLPSRTLDRYPTPGRRAAYLAVVVVVTIVLYYQIYVQGAVSAEIIADYGIKLSTFVLASILGNAVGAVSAWATGIADRWGRCNLIIGGAGLAAVLTLLGLPNAGGPTVYIALYTVLSLISGVVLVATQALVRDFSPQLGRAAAMGVWTLGPVLGNLVISLVTSATADAHPGWQFQYRLAGTLGAIAFVVALVGLRELSPALRDEVLLRAADHDLVQARVQARAQADVEAEAPLDGVRAPREPATGLRGMWQSRLVVPALGISLFLMFYATRVGFLVLYFATTFGYTTAHANGLASWYWVTNAVVLVATGFLSDRLLVRKPFMLAGALISLAALAVFATRATRPDTGYAEFVVLLMVLAAGGAMVNNAWLTLFSETIESIDPRAVARGMAVYGAVLRGVVTAVLVGFLLTVTAAGTLADHGPAIVRITTTHERGLTALGELPPRLVGTIKARPKAALPRVRAIGMLAKATPPTVRRALRGADGVRPAVRRRVRIAQRDLRAALAVPAADLATLARYGPDVRAAAADGPHQWQRWWWVCWCGQVAFLGLGFRMRGAWRPSTARQEIAVREEELRQERERLGVLAAS